METIQDRIIEKARKELGVKKIVFTVDGKTEESWFLDRETEQFLIQSIKEVEEETKGDVLNKLHAMVCDLATDKGKDLAKEDCLELIRYQIERIYGKKLLSITNKEKQNG